MIERRQILESLQIIFTRFWEILKSNFEWTLLNQKWKIWWNWPPMDLRETWNRNFFEFVVHMVRLIILPKEELEVNKMVSKEKFGSLKTKQTLVFKKVVYSKKFWSIFHWFKETGSNFSNSFERTFLEMGFLQTTKQSAFKWHFFSQWKS